MSKPARAKISHKELIIWAAIIAVAGFMVYGTFAAPHSELVGKPAPAFTMPQDSGDSVSLASLQGKVVVLNVYATWCPPCKREIPDFALFHKKIENDDSVMMYGVVFESGGKEKAARDSRALGVNYPILHGNSGLADQYHLHTYPTTVIIDGQGIVRDQIVGTLTYKQLEKLVAKAKHPASAAAQRTDTTNVAQRRNRAASTSAM